MTTAQALYGTDVPIAESERLRAGALSFTLEQGALRHIRVGDVEILRGISFLVRDRDWGTLSPKLEMVERQASDQGITLKMRAKYHNGPAHLTVDLEITAGLNALRFHATGQIEGDFETNRAGFTLLHPAALAGCPVQITHSNGVSTETEFPRCIDPWQPFMDISNMSHKADGFDVACAFEGDTSETEDQRQWGDASYKTYNRPLAKPWPYVLADGSQLEQSVTVSWRPCDAVPARWTPQEIKEPARFPETAILVNAVDVDRAIRYPDDVHAVGPQRLLCSVDEALGDVAAQFRAFAALQGHFPDYTFDLEAICNFDRSPLTVLEEFRHKMDAAGYAPESILVCPTVDRQSTPPGSDWPSCPPLEAIHAASATVFPDLLRGGGMTTFFPELNRKRPPVEMLDFVSHALCPIVHAADDVSVMETLEAIPHITATARSFIGDKPYRIGPSTIAMRHNPYGQRTIPNPHNDRVCMADRDPRHFAVFGAAYTLGLACALAPSGIAVWTPSELYGPRGLTGQLRELVTRLARLSNEVVHSAGVKDGIGRLCVGEQEMQVNLTANTRNKLAAFGWEEKPA